ncbi:MAG TPA: hypothetical protein VGH28_28270 [Polyangiaceae bacterium]|jgi:hypothetical protein
MHAKDAAAADRAVRIPQHSSKSSEYITPPLIIGATKAVMGDIDFDPASSARANTVVGAKTFLTAEDDGLTRPWLGRVFVNPPGGKVGNRSLAQMFYWKAVREWLAFRAASVVFVGFTLEILRLSQGDGSLPSALNFPMCVPAERTKFFVDQHGTLVPMSSPTHANVIIFMPATGDLEEHERFTKAFSAIGDLVFPFPSIRRSLVKP